jgi:mono/diheme cytochrome c family protein
MKAACVLLLASALLPAQDLKQALQRGEEVFKTNCATGYCHGQNGAAGGAPRLAARGFDQATINNVVSRGVTGTAMPAFAGTLSRADLIDVVAYVATLNGIANPSLTPPGRGGPRAAAPPEPPLSPEAARGRDLFYDAVRGFSRCSTCHEVNGMGMPVAAPISRVPADVAALRALSTPDVTTAVLDGESMPALVLSKGRQRTLFYDLTVPPPVLHTVDPSAVQFKEGSAWRHSAVIGSYSDAELSSILDFLRAVVNPQP